MKNFKSFLKETHTSHQDQAIDKNTNMAVFSDPTVVKKLNAWVGTIAGSYVLPEDAVHTLRSSLSKIGLSLGEVPVLEGESGSVELPLTSFGGRFGKGLTTPHDEFEVDDGIRELHPRHDFLRQERDLRHRHVPRRCPWPLHGTKPCSPAHGSLVALTVVPPGVRTDRRSPY